MNQDDPKPRRHRGDIRNNTCEANLKRAILPRKNSLFYKTLAGARVGDTFMSLIHTVELNGLRLLFPPVAYPPNRQGRRYHVHSQSGSSVVFLLPKRLIHSGIPSKW